jgi:Tfp pilus assembly protein PilN
VEVYLALARARYQDSRLQLQAKAEGLDVSDAALQRLPVGVAFANQVITKRAFSWTRFLSDLEEAVPPRVAIHNIRLDFKDSMITLSGSALTLQDLTTLIIGLEDHRAFKDAILGRHQVQDNSLDFTLTVRYHNDAQRS